MRVKIQLERGYLDLYPSTDGLFYVTKQIYDILNLQQRQADFTRSLSIPKTTNNLTLLNLYSNEQFNNDAFDCIILIDNISVFKAVLYINMLRYESVEINIYAGNFILFESIPNESIKTLDFSDLAITWTVGGITSEISNTSGPIFCRASWYDETTFSERFNFGGNGKELTDSYDIKVMGYFFYFKTIFEKIINNAGLSLDASSYSENIFYKNLVLACPTSFLNTDSVTDYAKNGKVADQTVYGAATYTDLTFPTAIDDSGVLWDTGTHEYNIAVNGEYTIKINYDVDYVKNSSYGAGVIDIQKNGSINLATAPFFASGNYSGTLSVTVTLTNADYISFRANGAFSGGADIIKVKAATTIELIESGGAAAEISPNDYFPEINQRTFFIEFLKIINGFLSVNPLTGLCKIVSLDDILYSMPQDWTANIIESEREELIGLPFYKQSDFIYSNDSNLRRSDADSQAIINNDSLINRGVVLQSEFSASDNSFIQDTAPAEQNFARISIPFYTIEYESVEGFNITSGSPSFNFDEEQNFSAGDYIYYDDMFYRIKSVSSAYDGVLYDPASSSSAITGGTVKIVRLSVNDITPRIALVNFDKQTSVKIDQNIFNDPSSTSYNLYEAEFSGLQMGNIISAFYKRLFDALQTPKVISALFMFNPLEFQNIDMQRPVQIKGINGLYYINSIQQYKVNEPCLVELVRINTLI